MGLSPPKKNREGEQRSGKRAKGSLVSSGLPALLGIGRGGKERDKSQTRELSRGKKQENAPLIVSLHELEMTLSSALFHHRRLLLALSRPERKRSKKRAPLKEFDVVALSVSPTREDGGGGQGLMDALREWDRMQVRPSRNWNLFSFLQINLLNHVYVGSSSERGKGG